MAQPWWKPPKAPPKSTDKCADCGAVKPPLRCSRCSCASYCNSCCQRSHWRAGHNKRCAELKAAVEAAAAVAPPPKEDNSVLAVPTSELYPYAAFVEDWQTLGPRLDVAQPLGIPNKALTCYLASILQCLLAARPLSAHLVAHSHAATCPRPTKDAWCPLCALETAAAKAFAPAAERPTSLSLQTFVVGHALALGPHFRLFKQHDAQELFIQLLEAAEAVAAREAVATGAPPPADAPSARTTALHHAFSTCVRATVDCCMCGSASKTYTVESQVMVPVPPGDKPTSLDALLREWAAPETMDGDASYECSVCARKVRAQRSMALEIAPNVLVCHLNRTNWVTDRKNAAPVAFPVELDLEDPEIRVMAYDAVDSVTPARYRLSSLVAHDGDAMDDGHYTAWVRYGDRWFFCDDDSVAEVKEEAVLAQCSTACIVFYERETPRAPLRSGVEEAEAVLRAMEAEEAAAAEGLAALQIEPAAVSVSPSLSTGSSLEHEEDPLNLGYSYACRLGPMTDGGRVLRFEATLTGGDGDGGGGGEGFSDGSEPELILEDDLEGERWLELHRGGRQVLRLRAPTKVGPAVRDVLWKPDHGQFVALLDVQ